MGHEPAHCMKPMSLAASTTANLATGPRLHVRKVWLHAGSGEVSARAGVVELMDGAKAAGIPVAVCSAATKAAVEVIQCSCTACGRLYTP